MWHALDPAGHRVPRTMPTCLLHTWRPHRRRPFTLVLHLHQHQSSRNMHLHNLAMNQSTQPCQSLITQGSDHPPVLEPHMVLTPADCTRAGPTRSIWSSSHGHSVITTVEAGEKRLPSWHAYTEHKPTLSQASTVAILGPDLLKRDKRSKLK
jgi:hypothetical protein